MIALEAVVLDVGLQGTIVFKELALTLMVVAVPQGSTIK
jgi:hypothetical protein